MACVLPLEANPLQANPKLTAHLLPLLGPLGACPRCVLRFIGVAQPEQYLRPQEEVWDELLRTLDTSSAAQPCARVSACCVCLGTMAAIDDQTVVSTTLDHLRRVSICSSRFALEVALPASALVRQRGMYLHAAATVGREMPRADALVDLKAALKWQWSGAIAKTLSAKRDDEAPYHVTISFEHAMSESETAAIVDPDDLRRGDKRQRTEHDASATSVRSVLKALFERDCRDRLVRAHLCPPASLAEACAVSASTFHAPICVGGSYNKLSREMPQTPWWLDGEKRGLSSVQEELQSVLLGAFGGASSTFHGAGREDMDVRMLGTGRPFVLELNQPTLLGAHCEIGASLAELQAAINASCEHVKVRDLAVVPSSTIAGLVRDGESDHRKAYRCIVWLSRALTAEEVSLRINRGAPVRLDQKTPIRVLHRRPLLTRPRTVFSMHAELLNPRYLMLDLVTQAGTYIKEFVHGDFGRTVPNLGSLLDCSADILQLDVMAILAESEEFVPP